MYKILIVDDDYAIRLLYQSELEDEGYSVTTASGCLNILEQIDHLRPDLILLAIRLGEINGLDILFNNAAIHGGDEHLSEVDAETLLRVIHVNAVGAVLVAQAFVELLRKGLEPKLVNVSSEAGSIERMRHFRGYNYYGSKATMNMYTRSLAWS